MNYAVDPEPRLHHTWAVFQNQPDQGFGHYDLVQAGDMGMDELAVVVDFPGQVGVVPVGRLENHLQWFRSAMANDDGHQP